MSGLIFGCGRIVGGIGYKDSKRILTLAYDLGINSFDIAPSYGDGDVEDVLRKVFGAELINMDITTKIGLRRVSPPRFHKQLLRKFYRSLPGFIKNKNLANSSYKSSVGDMNVDFLRKSFYESIDLLKIDFIPSVLLHEPRSCNLQPSVSDFMNELVTKGLIKKWGTGTGMDVEHIVPLGDIYQFKYTKNAVNSLGNTQGVDLRMHGLFRNNPYEEAIDCIKKSFDPSSKSRNIKFIFSTTSCERLNRFVMDVGLG